MSKVIVIGGGASGLISAIYAAKNSNEVTILEKNDNCGKKILITGNGRCNYWNSDQNLEHYHSNNKEIIPSIINSENNEEILHFFTNIGIIPKIKNGYYYPYSNQASSIKDSLLKEVLSSNIKIINNVTVEKLIKKDKVFIINPDTNNIECEEVILATGSKACPKTGSDGKGYEIAASFSHTIIEVLPSLVQLKGNDKILKKWDGVRSDVKLSLYEDNKLTKEEKGEIQLTNYGISGICTFNLSGIVSRGLSNKKQEEVLINFVPWLETDLLTWLEERNITIPNRKINELLEGFLNKTLVHAILDKSNIDINKNWNNLTKEEKLDLVNNIRSYKFTVTDTNSFDKCQVCSGGVSLTEINPKTMESLKVKGLYLVGELLDVDGDCGGYNLGFAWTTGMLAGKMVGNK